MKKSDLQNGMIVECENGDRFIVVKNFCEHTNILPSGSRDVLLKFYGGYMTFSDYDEDLRIIGEDEHGYSIAKVGYPKHIGCPIDAYIKWMWERKKVTLTEDEKAILRNLDKRYKWITRSYGMLEIYEEKQEAILKHMGVIYGDRVWLKPFDHLFTFIKDEDTEPYLIEELLSNGSETK